MEVIQPPETGDPGQILPWDTLRDTTDVREMSDGQIYLI